MIERHYSLSRAAKIIGVGRECLKRWLIEDLAMALPPVARGSKVMIRERDLEIVLRKRTPKSNFAVIRRHGAA